MNYYGIGSTLKITWKVLTTGGDPFPLDRCTLKVYAITSRGITQVPDADIDKADSNIISWTYKPARMMICGMYSLEMKIFLGEKMIGELQAMNAFGLHHGVSPTKDELEITNYSDLFTQEVSFLLAEAERQEIFDANEADRQAATEELKKVASTIEELKAGAALGATAVQTESDPTVPAWAKQPQKPTYNWSEIKEKPAVALIGDIPTKTSQLQNDSGFLTQLKTINGQTITGSGNVTIEGTKDYSALSNKPSIEGVTLSGNKAASDLGLATTADTASLSQEVSSLNNAVNALSSGLDSVGEVVDSLPKQFKTVNGQDITGSGNITVEGTKDYSALTNKPKIGGTELSGNKEASDLGLATTDEITDLNSKVGDLSVLNTSAKANLVDAINEINSKPSTGGGGTSDYSALSNKPKIEGVELNGDTGLSDIGAATTASVEAIESEIGDIEDVLAGINGGGEIIIAGGGGEDYDQLSNRPKISGIVITGDKTLAEYGAATSDSVASLSSTVSALSSTVASKQDIISDLDNIRTGAGKGASAYQKPAAGIPKTDLASAVQTSLGKADSALQSHQDISGKQDVISDLATIRTNATRGASAYQKPSGGIPKSDLASAVQTSLGKADTALQSHQILKTINGSSIVGSGNIDLYTTDDGEELRGQLATQIMMYAQEVDETYAKKTDVPTKVSELTNDSGYLTSHQDISGKADKITASASMPAGGFLANVLYRLGELSGAVTFTLAESAEDYAEYMIEFTTGAEAPSITWPSGIKFLAGEAPTINASKTYSVSIVDNLAVCGEF